MKTLLEFITLTKGMEYLIAIAFLFGFIAFWLLLQHKGKGLAIRIIPVIVLMLGVGALASTCALPEASEISAEPSGAAQLLNSAVLVEMYGPASFGHELHQRISDDCTSCHHYSENRTPLCKECHNTSFDPDDLHKPGIDRIFHLRCISCHVENQAGPTECTQCHSKAAVPPLSITHPLTGNGNCLGCHDLIPGVPALPADHNNGVTNGVCELCHQPTMEVTALATRKLTHDITGQENCLLCHGEGIAGAAKVPADHAGRTNETCQTCHQSL